MKKINGFLTAACVVAGFIFSGGKVQAQNWSLTGNAGTIPATNFLGTTDTATLVFKVNDVQAGWIDKGKYQNTFLGYVSGTSITTGVANTGIGYAALLKNTTGVSNTANGFEALFSNITGSSNTAVGYFTLYANTTGTQNTALGVDALYSNISGGNNIAIGQSALAANASGNNNTATGYYSLTVNTSGGYNTAYGAQTLYSNTTGTENTATGNVALEFNTTGTENTATGNSALRGNTTGSNNTATGWGALYSNITGNNSTANGYGALYSNTSGVNNTTNGTAALYNNTTGSSNSALGFYAGVNSTGSWNTFVGDSAGDNNTTGTYNTYLGYESGISNKSLSNQIYLGDSTGVAAPKAVKFAGALEPYYSSNYQVGSSGQVLTSQGAGVAPQWVTPTAASANAWSLTGNAGTSPATNFLGTTDTATLVFKVNNLQAGWIDDGVKYANTYFGYKSGIKTLGVRNTGIGYFALLFNTTGDDNTAVGWESLYSNTTGDSNTATVYTSLAFNSTGGENTANGWQALVANTSGSFNTATGCQALSGNFGGSHNTATGYRALTANDGGTENTAVGYDALSNSTEGSSITALGSYAGANSAGSWNTFLGDSAGYYNTTGYDNTFVGYQAGNSTSLNTIANTTCLGYNAGSAFTIGSDNIYLGNSSVAHIYAEVTTITFSDRRIKDNIQENVPGLAFITKLKPVTYNLNIHKQNELMGVKDDKDWDGKYDIEKTSRTGFIAQDVEAAAQSCGYDFSGVAKPQTADGLYGLAYSDFVVPLVKAVQELNAKNDSLVSRVNSRGSVIDSLRNAFKNIQACLNKICIESTNSNNGNIGENNAANSQDVTLSSVNAPLLYQNVPNPFGSGGAKINYYLPEGTQGATVVFYDNYGNQLKQVQLSQTGNGVLNVTPDKLSNGIYSYSLIVNGNVIDTKRMVLQK